MHGPQHLLRKKAIERMSSPEQLDTTMRVTSPAGWVALAALGVVLIATVVWSIYGRVTVRVDGTGILLRGGSLDAVEAPASGRIDELMVEAGDEVEVGDQVAKLELPELEAEIAATNSRIRDLAERQEDQGGQLSELERAFETQIADLQEQLRRKEELRARGLAREQDVLAIKGQIAAVRAQMIQAGMGEDSVFDRLEEEKRRLTQLQANRNSQSVVTSRYRGRVAAVLVETGDLIEAGSRIVTLEEGAEAPLEVVLFIPFSEGKKVRPEMEVKISPTNVKPEEFGFILGEIDSVSDLPATLEEVRRTLNNDQLAQKFTEDTPFKVAATPERDPSSPSGFRWTSAGGPPLEISSGTPCTAQVIVERRAPISYVIPMIKKATGMD